MRLTNLTLTGADCRSSARRQFRLHGRDRRQQRRHGKQRPTFPSASATTRSRSDEFDSLGAIWELQSSTLIRRRTRPSQTTSSVGYKNTGFGNDDRYIVEISPPIPSCRMTRSSRGTGTDPAFHHQLYRGYSYQGMHLSGERTICRSCIRFDGVVEFNDVQFQPVDTWLGGGRRQLRRQPDGAGQHDLRPNRRQLRGGALIIDSYALGLENTIYNSDLGICVTRPRRGQQRLREPRRPIYVDYQGVAEGNRSTITPAPVSCSTSACHRREQYDLRQPVGIQFGQYRNSTGHTIINNTIVQDSGEALYLATPNAPRTVFENNIISLTNAVGIVAPANNQVGFVSDYNLFPDRGWRGRGDLERRDVRDAGRFQDCDPVGPQQYRRRSEIRRPRRRRLYLAIQLAGDRPRRSNAALLQ